LAAIRARIERVRSELDRANRRMFDIRTSEYLMKGQPEQETRGRARPRTAAPTH
jgi:hypothetical protein